MTPADPQSIRFRIIGPRAKIPASGEGWSAFLNRDEWDDWGKFSTQFYLTVVGEDGKHHEVGRVKIGERGLKPHASAADLPQGFRKPNLDPLFEQLGDDFFSVGQDDEYYANLDALGDSIREQVLSRLGDVAWDPARWEWARHEVVMEASLLRSVTRSTVEGQFSRMAHGDARVTRYNFAYSPPKRLSDRERPMSLDFSVDPNSPIPTNVHVLIGRNGVGKTRMLSLMTKALVAKEATAHQSGKFDVSDVGGVTSAFANVVAVSFSAFDETPILPDRSSEPDSLGFAYIGLGGNTSESPPGSTSPKSLDMLATDFVKSLRECRIGARRRRWVDVLTTLQSDPVFKAAELLVMIEADLSKPKARGEVSKTFKALSAGHKIVLLALTRLVEVVEERTLVLIDEPEAHLHPPLLSAMIRTISELMVKRNGVAIIATHSPIVLQEVPRSCVWLLNRVSRVSKVERPSIETFGESVGTLSREVFQLELSQSGYHQLLGALRKSETTYVDALHHLGGQIGAEGRAVLRAMYLNSEA